MKKIILILLFVFSIFAFASCEFLNTDTNNPKDDVKDTDTTDPEDDKDNTMAKDPVDLTIFAINDFHGVVFEKGSYAGISKIGSFLENNTDENTVLISSGDMYQGTAVSSMTRGRVMVDCMNYLGFDAMAVGNHEFDWGIEEILKYYDGDTENGEAEFPLLCANCKDLETGSLASWCVPYTVVERFGVKIGIIGVIGQNEESDILESNVRMYDFTDELTAIKKYSKILHDDEKCDLVIVSAHLDTSDINFRLANLTGSERIDVILNGHTHQAYKDIYTREDGSYIPMVQSGCYGTYIGRIDITYDPKTKMITKATCENIEAIKYAKSESQGIEDILAKYQEYIDLANSYLGTSKSYIDKYTMGPWISDQIKKIYDADVGIVNTGGVRGNAFPIQSGQELFYDSVFQMLPFENKIQVVEIKGSALISLLYSSGSYFFSSNVSGDYLTINGNPIDSNRYYKIVTIDYLYEKSYLPFKDGINHISYDDLIREVIVTAISDNIKKNGKFDVRG